MGQPDEELLWRFPKPEDPDVRARQQRILEVLLTQNPEVKERLVEEARLTEARAALRRVLACRQFAITSEDEARIAACGDLATLERWHDQAVTAPSVGEALQ